MAVQAFADGFQGSEFLPSRRAPEIDDLRATELLQRVLNAWPVPLRGHSYTIQAVEADAPVLQAYGAGRLDATSTLLAGLGLLDSELSALLALAVARTELDHPARFLQSAPRAFHEGIARAGARGVPEEGVRPALSASNLAATEHPSCWFDGAGRPEYVWDVTVHVRGLLLRPGPAPANRHLRSALPLSATQTGRYLSDEQFLAQTQALYEYSVSQACRFYVRLFNNARGFDPIGLFDEKERVVQQHFLTHRGE